MSYGDPNNSRAWTNANVFISFEDDPALPATIADEFGVDWEQVGILDGGQGFTEGTTETVTDTFGWGQILLASRVSDQKTTKTFTAMEINETTDRLRGIEDGVQYRRAAERVKIAFETIDASKGQGQRYICSNNAEVRINGDLTETETGVATFPFIATIFPDSDLGLWVIQRGAASA